MSNIRTTKPNNQAKYNKKSIAKNPQLITQHNNQRKVKANK